MLKNPGELFWSSGAKSLEAAPFIKTYIWQEESFIVFDWKCQSYFFLDPNFLPGEKEVVQGVRGKGGSLKGKRKVGRNSATAQGWSRRDCMIIIVGGAG